MDRNGVFYAILRYFTLFSAISAIIFRIFLYGLKNITKFAAEFIY